MNKIIYLIFFIYKIHQIKIFRENKYKLQKQYKRDFRRLIKILIKNIWKKS